MGWVSDFFDGFKEAIKEAQEICETEGKKAKECHLVWYEVDELEDAINRYYPDL